MRKHIFFLSFFLLFTCISAQSVQSVLDSINFYKNCETFRHGQWSLYAEYTDDGQEITSLNAEEALAPASGLKVFTSSCALSRLGEDFRFETRLYYDGKISPEGTLNGNIYIRGGGDPALGSTLVKGSLSLDSLMSTWIMAIKAAGIKSISGQIISDDLLYERNPVPDYWPWIDIGNYYGAGTSALCIGDNLYHLYFKPGLKAGDKADVLRTEPEIPALSFINEMKTGKEGSGDNGYIYCAPYQTVAYLRGTVPAGVKEFSIKGSIPDPPFFAADYLARSLIKKGISFLSAKEGSPAFVRKSDEPLDYKDKNLLSSILSPPVKDIVFIINKRSNNLYTEQLLKAIAFKHTGKGNVDDGLEDLYGFLKSGNIPTEGISLYDGCGLSRTDAITAKAMVKLLSYNTKQAYFESFYRSLGVAADPDDAGYFQNYGKNTIIAKNARIKDGLISGVRSHSGYVTSKSGRLIAFSFIANNYEGSARKVNEIHTGLMIKLAELK